MTHANDFGSRRILCVFSRYEPSFGTFEHRISKPLSPYRRRMIPRGLAVLGKLLWSVGLKGEGGYRPVFWRFAWPLILKGQLEALLMYCLMGHHLIVFAREVCAGHLNASHYSVKLRRQEPALQAAE